MNETKPCLILYVFTFHINSSEYLSVMAPSIHRALARAPAMQRNICTEYQSLSVRSKVISLTQSHVRKMTPHVQDKNVFAILCQRKVILLATPWRHISS